MNSAIVTPELLDVLGVAPLRGRLFNDPDAAVGADDPSRASRLLHHEDLVLAENPGEHPRQLLGESGDVEVLRTHELPPAEGEQMVGKRGGPIGGLDDRCQISVAPLVGEVRAGQRAGGG